MTYNFKLSGQGSPYLKVIFEGSKVVIIQVSQAKNV